MIDDASIVHRYLAPPTGWFWQWSDGGEVIAWSNGATIAFRGELVQVLERLAPRGLPPFDTVVLILAACRGTWQTSSPELSSLVSTLAGAGRRTFPQGLSQVLAGLDAVAQLPAGLRSGVEAEAVLVELVLEESRYRTTPTEADAIVDILRRTRENHTLHHGGNWWIWEDLLRDLRILQQGLPRVDAGVLELRLRTGLDQIVQPADLKLEPAQRARRLISELQNDLELGGLARIARQLMAAVHLPRAVEDHEDLPVGGISDIANRGPLDRLLLGELAQDGMTLAVRVALNEALYWRRESPPRTPPRHRAVLVDAGIRLWGIPRVFATAVALALAAGGSQNVRVDAYRAKSKRVVPIDLTWREGILRHMEALEPEAHPGDALPAFLQAVSSRSDPMELVIVTGDDAAADPEFVRAISSLEIPSLYLATVSRSGQFRMIARGSRSSKVIREAKLRLEELLAPPASARPSPLVDRRVPDALPAIFSAGPFPLLLPHQVDLRRTWAVWGWGALALTTDGRLMHWARPDRGARQLSDHVSIRGPALWHAAGAYGGTTALAVIGDHPRTPAKLLLANLETGKVRTVPLELRGEAVLGFYDRADQLFAIYGNSRTWVRHVDVLSVASGRRVSGGCAMKRGVWYAGRGRVFLFPDGWYVLDWDGLQIRWERLIDSQISSRLHLMGFFERMGRAGFFGLSLEGRLYRECDETWTDLLSDLPGPFWLSFAAPDGESLLVSEQSTPRRFWQVDVATGRRRPVVPGNRPWELVLREQALSWIRPRSLPRRFREIGRDKEALILVSRRAWFRIEWDSCRGRIRMQQMPTGHVLPLRRAFEPAAGPPGTRYELRVARWEDGSRAWLDSRGLLHLQSSDSRVPEASLVLDPNCVSGWASDGRHWGSAYYLGDNRPHPAMAVFNEILKPFAAQLR